MNHMHDGPIFRCDNCGKEHHLPRPCEKCMNPGNGTITLPEAEQIARLMRHAREMYIHWDSNDFDVFEKAITGSEEFKKETRLVFLHRAEDHDDIGEKLVIGMS